jgi:hypothetical protein
MDQFRIEVEGAAAQDLYFIERAVPEARVEEKAKPSGSSTSHGMPGLAEAVILLAAKGAIAAAVAWILQHRKRGRMTIRRCTGADGSVEESRSFEWTEQTNDETLISKIEAWVS